MFVVPKDASAELPVIFRDDENYATVKTGIAFGAVTLKFRKWPAVAWTTDTIDAGNWTEIGDGHYTWEATSGDLDTAGLFFYIVQSTDCVQYEGAVYISDNDFDDLATDIAALNDPTAATIADAIWDEVASGHVTAGTFGKYVNDLNTNIDVVLSTRSSHSATDVDTELSGTHGAGSWEGSPAADVADAVWDEAAGDHTGAGSFGKYVNDLNTNIDVVLSTRSSHSAADVDTTLTASHGAGSWTSSSPPSAAAIADAVWDEAAGDHTGAGSFGESIDTLTTNIDVVLSTRSSHDAADVDTTLTASHGAGSWTGSSAADVADAVWDEAAAGHTAAGSFGEAIDTLTTNIDVVLSTRSSHDAADVDTQLSGVHGAGSWEGGGAAPTVGEIADAVWDEIASGHVGAGSFGEAIDTLTTNIDVVLSTRSSHSAADVDAQLSGVHGAGSWEGGGAAPTVGEIADAVLEELIADHTSISGSLADVIDEIHNYHLSPGGHVEWE